MSGGLVGVLLSAGQSTRFGSDKRLHPLEDGTPMAVAAARRLHSVLADSLAVVDELESEVAIRLADEGLRLVANPRARDGMGTSIACGVAASRDALGWVVALADMPYIPASVIQAVVAALLRGSDIVAPAYRGQRGHPVGFSARHAPALMQLDSDEGARRIIAANPDSLDLIDVPHREVLIDIDRKNGASPHRADSRSRRRQ